MMKKILIALYIAFVGYSFTLFFYGDMGVKGLDNLLNQRDIMQSNLSRLEQEYFDLESEAIRLKKDSGTVIVRARDLGFIEEGQKLVITNWNLNYTKPVYTLIETAYLENHKKNRQWGLLGFIMFSGCLGFLLLFRRKENVN